jgi:hypothetical protein
MICLRCRDLHAGNDLSLADGGVSLTLGDCPKGGARHEWRKGHFVLDVPYVVHAGDWKVRNITVADARAFVRAPLVISCIRVAFISRFLSGLLDIPLIHRKNPQLRMDIGDEAMAAVIKPGYLEKDPMSLVFQTDYELLLIEKVT